MMLNPITFETVKKGGRIRHAIRQIAIVGWRALPDLLNLINHKKLGWNMLFILSLPMLTSCTGLDLLKNAKKILHEVTAPELLPSIAAEKKPAPSTVTMMVYAENYITVNSLNESPPIHFTVIQLKGDDELYSATFDGLTAKGAIKKILQPSYIKHTKHLVSAGSFTPLPPFKLEEKTQHIAVISSYDAFARGIWRVSKKAKPVDKAYAIQVVMQKSGIKMEVKNND